MDCSFFRQWVQNNFKVNRFKKREHIANRLFPSESQKAILLGKQGAAIKKLGTESRKKIEAVVQKKVFLELTVKVVDNWRDDEQALRRFGYEE